MPNQILNFRTLISTETVLMVQKIIKSFYLRALVLIWKTEFSQYDTSHGTLAFSHFSHSLRKPMQWHQHLLFVSNFLSAKINGSVHGWWVFMTDRSIYQLENGNGETRSLNSCRHQQELPVNKRCRMSHILISTSDKCIHSLYLILTWLIEPAYSAIRVSLQRIMYFNFSKQHLNVFHDIKHMYHNDSVPDVNLEVKNSQKLSSWEEKKHWEALNYSAKSISSGCLPEEVGNLDLSTF